MKKLLIGLTLLSSLSAFSTETCKVKLEPVQYQVAGDYSKAMAIAKKAIEAKSTNFTVVSDLKEANLLMKIETIAGHYTLESDIKENDGLVIQKLRKGAVATVQVFKPAQNNDEYEFVTGIRAFEDQYFNNIKNSHERIREAINALPSCEEMLKQ